MEDKKSIRGEVRRRIKQMSEQEKRSAARAIFEAVEATAEFNEAECVALFAAMWDEVPTDEALERWRLQGKRVIVPRVEGDIMRYYPYSPDQMREGAFGIMEPVGEVEVEPSAIDLMIVPARAFTPHGERLGRGGGFYDKYMSLSGFRATTFGIAFASQIFDTLPTDPHDIAVDRVFSNLSVNIAIENDTV